VEQDEVASAIANEINVELGGRARTSHQVHILNDSLYTPEDTGWVVVETGFEPPAPTLRNYSFLAGHKSGEQLRSS
jgi:hypothetical protein